MITVADWLWKVGTKNKFFEELERSIEFMKSINFLLFHEHNGISTQLTKSVTTTSIKYNAYKIDVFNHNLKLCSGYILIMVEIQ